jgi:glycyl-tRNA synthetase (class II)
MRWCVQGSELYGGLTSSFDYGPLGSQLKKNIQDLWWRDFVLKRKDCVGLDSSILLHPKGTILLSPQMCSLLCDAVCGVLCCVVCAVWESAGHTRHFIDPLIECKKCHTRQRSATTTPHHTLLCSSQQQRKGAGHRASAGWQATESGVNLTLCCNRFNV